MSLTLVEASKIAANRGETVRASIIEEFARASDLLRVIPFRDIQGNAYSYNREGALPSVAFRGVNESYTESTGVVNPQTEALRIAGGDLDVDQFIIQTGGPGIREVHESLKIKALAAEMTRVVIKGDSETQPREFDGLQKRITGSQLIAAGTTDNGDALSLLKLDELIDAVAGDNKYLIMNKTMRRRLTAASRLQSVGGHVDFDKDAFGRRVTVYNDVPILVPYSDNGGTDPIDFTEQGDVGGTPGGATSTSIYCVAFGDGLTSGIQSGMMQVRDLGELDDSPKARTRVEWYAGLCIEHGRSAARLGGISNAAVVA